MTDAGTVFGMPDEALSIEGVEALADDAEETQNEDTAADTAEDTEAAEIEETAAQEADSEAVETNTDADTEEVDAAAQDEAEQWYEFAGRRFTSQEEAERSYAEMQGLQSRTVEQQRAMEQAYQRREQEVAQFLQQIAPVLEQAQQARQAPAPQVPGPGDQNFDPENPEQVTAWVNSQVEQRVQAATQQMSQAFDQRLNQSLQPMQQQQAAWMQAQAQQRVAQDMDAYSADIDGFRTDHPEVTVGSPSEAAVAGVLQPLKSIAVMPSRPMLQMALDATRAPALYGEIEAERIRVESIAAGNPSLPVAAIQSLFDSDQGIATLYRRAGLAPQGTQAGGRSPQETQARRPHVETGGNGAPVDTAPGQVPDELDEAFKAYHGDEKKKSPLFAGGL